MLRGPNYHHFQVLFTRMVLFGKMATPAPSATRHRNPACPGGTIQACTLHCAGGGLGVGLGRGEGWRRNGSFRLRRRAGAEVGGQRPHVGRELLPQRRLGFNGHGGRLGGGGEEIDEERWEEGLPHIRKDGNQGLRRQIFTGRGGGRHRHPHLVGPIGHGSHMFMGKVHSRVLGRAHGSGSHPHGSISNGRPACGQPAGEGQRRGPGPASHTAPLGTWTVSLRRRTAARSERPGSLSWFWFFEKYGCPRRPLKKSNKEWGRWRGTLARTKASHLESLPPPPSPCHTHHPTPTDSPPAPLPPPPLTPSCSSRGVAWPCRPDPCTGWWCRRPCFQSTASPRRPAGAAARRGPSRPEGHS